MAEAKLPGKNSVLKILLVDDAGLIRERIKIILQQVSLKLSFVEAANVKDALRLLFETKPDVIIMDIKMPGENGINLLKEVKNDCYNVKTIILTNYPHEQYRKKCFELGTDYFLSKLTEFEKLPSVIKQIHIDLLNIKKN